MHPGRVLSDHLLAVVATAGAVLLRLALNPWLGHSLPFITLYGAVAAAVWFGGWAPALLSAVIGYVAADLLIVETDPGSLLSVHGPGGMAGALIYLASVCVVIGFGHATRKAHERLEAAARAALEQKQALERETAVHLRTAEALRAKESELEWVASHTPVLLTRCDKERRYVYVNQAAAEFLGRPAEEIIGRPVSEILGKEALAAIAPHIERVLHGDVVEYETTIPYASPAPGERIMQIVYTPDRDARGEVAGWVATIRDVTERRRGQEAIRERERLFRTLVTATSQSVWHYSPGGAPIRQFSDRSAAWWREFTGQREEQRTGKEGLGWLDVVHPEDRDAALRNWRAIIAAKDPTAVEFRVRRQDGAWRRLDIRGVPVRDEAGNVQEVVGTIVDVTERHEAERALRESEERFRLMADAAPVLIWVSGTDRKCTWFNKPWLDFVGRPMEKEIGDGWAENVHPDDFERCLETYVAAFDARRDFSMEYRLRRHDGAYRWVLDNGVPRRGEGEQFLGYIGSCIDITARREHEEALQDADRRKDEFLATLAHELRNPLAPVRNAVEILRLRGSGDPEAQAAREVIDRQMRQMTRLIDDLMDVSRITRGRLELRRERTTLLDVLQVAVETIRAPLDAAEQALEMRVPPEPVYLDGDPTRLAQVFANLLGNAVKFSPRGGCVRVSAERGPSDVLVTVRDAGCGIPGKMLPHVFDLFVQGDGDGSMERRQEGLGIGLTLVKRLVEMHGGRVEARSEGPGRGSEFTIRLPLGGIPASGMVPVVHAMPGAVGAMGRGRVLVADDNRDAASSLSAMLGILGYDIRTAYDGAEALQAAEEFRPQAALLDIGMPHTNGYDVARHIRRQPWGREMVLLAVTGWGQAKDRERTLEAGFDHHLVKPVDPKLLATLLSTGRPKV
jgi:PAS domain S-box-containing protein